MFYGVSALSTLLSTFISIINVLSDKSRTGLEMGHYLIARLSELLTILALARPLNTTITTLVRIIALKVATQMRIISPRLASTTMYLFILASMVVRLTRVAVLASA